MARGPEMPEKQTRNVACGRDIYDEVPNGLAKTVFNGSPPSHR